MARNNAVWGIDIGNSALKALRCLPDADPQKVIVDGFDYIEYPKILTQPDADPPKLVADALKQFLTRNSVRGDRVAVSVSGQSGLARFIKLPPVEAKKIPDIVKYEARQQIPFALEDVVWDYQQIAGGGEEDGFALETEVGLFAMKRDQVYQAIRPFTDAKVEVDVVQLAPLAVFNCVAFDKLRVSAEGDSSDPGEYVAVLSVGTDTTDLVVTNGQRVWQRSIPLGGSHFTKALTKELKLTFAKAEHLKRNVTQAEDPKMVIRAMRSVFNDFVTEVQRSIGYYKSIDRKAKIGRVLALGNAMKLPGFQRFLSQNLELEVESLTSLPSLTGDAVTGAPAFKNNLLSFGVCYGLAVQGMGRSKLSTNLMPKEVVTQRLVRSKKPWAVAAAAVILLGCAINYYGAWQAWAVTDPERYRSAFSSTEAIVSEVNNYKSQYESSKAKYEEIQDIGKTLTGNVEGRLAWLELMKAINACLPRDDRKLSDFKNSKEDYISQRDILYITSLRCEEFAEGERYTNLSEWWTNTSTPLQRGGQGGYGAGYGGYGGDAGGYGAGGGSGYGGSGYDTPAVEDFSDEPEEGGESGPEGEGWVIQLDGYHFHNEELSNSGAEFVRQTFIKQLQEGKILLPAGEGQPPEEVAIADLGISHPVIRWKSPVYEMKIPDPTQDPQDASANGENGEAEDAPLANAPGTYPGAAGAGGYLSDVKMLDLKKFDFVIQFAWKPTLRSERLQQQAERALAAQEAAANAPLEENVEDSAAEPLSDQGALDSVPPLSAPPENEAN